MIPRRNNKFGLKKGDQIGGWRLIEPLGEGGNSFVWRAVNDGEKALKVAKFRLDNGKCRINSYVLKTFNSDMMPAM